MEGRQAGEMSTRTQNQEELPGLERHCGVVVASWRGLEQDVVVFSGTGKPSQDAGDWGGDGRGLKIHVLCDNASKDNLL